MMEKDFGFVKDVCADFKTGNITAIIVPGSPKSFSFISGNDDIVIPWEKIHHIGDDVILVNI